MQNGGQVKEEVETEMLKQKITSKYIDTNDYTAVIKKLRAFFEAKGFLEVHTQNRLSILAACEDPTTITKFNYNGNVWPMPQTGQMWLEWEMLNNPDRAPGYYCISTSYRNEPNPVEGRHELIFPMFEFELKGGIEELQTLEEELLTHLGFGKEYFNMNIVTDQPHAATTNFGTVTTELRYPSIDYDDAKQKFGVEELENEHEALLCKENGSVCLLKNFPNTTSPFWNMRQNDAKTHANKIDVLLHGMETIGSAERSTDVEEMRKQFHNISEGGYADILYNNFTKDRVEKELNDFLSFNFFKRSGGGIGVTRLIRAMKLSNLLHDNPVVIEANAL
jgi:aspartyl/asparaginyl-tRNA synthetase